MLVWDVHAKMHLRFGSKAVDREGGSVRGKHTQAWFKHIEGAEKQASGRKWKKEKNLKKAELQWATFVEYSFITKID